MMKDDSDLNVEREVSFKTPSQSREMLQNKNIPHAVVMREYGTSRCLNQLTSEFRTIAEEKLIRKQHREMKCELPDFTRSTYLMVFSPDGKKMASSHGNHNVYVTDVKTGKNLNTLSGHPRTPWCIAFHPSSNQILASGCLGGQVRVWDLHGGSEIWTVEGQTSIASLAFHPSDRLLVIASYNEILFWDWSQPEPFTKCCTLSEKEKIRYVAFDYTGTKLITGIEIPKPLASQWDRVGPGGQANNLGGPRLSGQRQGFGPVFGRSSHNSDVVSGSAQPTPSTPTFNSLHRASASQLEGRIRQNVQLLQFLLDARRISQQESNRPLPRRLPPRSNVSPVSHSNQLDTSEDSGNIASSSPLRSRIPIAELSLGSSSASRNFNQRRNSYSAVVSGSSENERQSGARNLGNRNQSASIAVQPASASVTNESNLYSNDDTSTTEGTHHQELGNVDQTNALSNSSSVTNLRNQRLTNVQSGGLRGWNSSRTTRQSLSSNSTNSNLTNNINVLSDGIRCTLHTLSEHVDNMQHCSRCLPQMNSSRLSHIQQLWAELRDQIRSLQSSIWENTNLVTSAWHRSSFEAITEMLSRMNPGEADRLSGRSRQAVNTHGTSNSSLSETQRVSLSEGSSFNRSQLRGDAVSNPVSSGSNSRSYPFSPSSQSEASATVTSLSNMSNVTGVGSSNLSQPSGSSSSASLTQPRFKANLNRTLLRPCHAQRLLYVRNQLARRVSNTVRGQGNSPGRLAQTSFQHSTHTRNEAEQYPSSSIVSDSLSRDQQDLSRELLPSPKTAEARSSYQNAADVQEGQASTYNVDHMQHITSSALPSMERNNSIQNMVTDDRSNDSSHCPMSKHRLLIGRRRHAPPYSLLRSLRARGSLRPQVHRGLPQRFFGGRRSFSEVTPDLPSSRAQGQRPRNTPTNTSSTVRSPDSMLMRIFQSLRRAATLTGRSSPNEAQPTGTRENHLDVEALHEPNVEATANVRVISSQTHTASRPQPSSNSPSSGLRLWTQYSGPDGDVLHIRAPHPESMDSNVQESISRIRSSGTMSVVQDGVMTEELSSNLLRLHLHMQHQELQLRQHQARLRTRFQNQSIQRNLGQVQRDLSRRLAQCSLCGGSVYLSPHFLVRLGNPPPNPPPAHSSSLSSPAWRQWTSPSPNPPPAHVPSNYSHPLLQDSLSPPHLSEQSSSAPSPTPSQVVHMPTLQVPLQNLPQPAHPPLQPPLMQSHQSVPRTTSPPHLPQGPLLSPQSPSPSSSSNSLPPPLSPTPPTQSSPLPSSPVSQVSTQTNSRYFSTNSTGFSNSRILYSSSKSLFWQVPASHHRNLANQPLSGLRTSPTLRSLSHQGPPETSVIKVSRDTERNQCSNRSSRDMNPSCTMNEQVESTNSSDRDLPSTSSGLSGSGSRRNFRSRLTHTKTSHSGSSSSDSETDGSRGQRQLRRNDVKSLDLKAKFKSTVDRSKTETGETSLQSPNEDTSASRAGPSSSSSSANGLRKGIKRRSGVDLREHSKSRPTTKHSSSSSDSDVPFPETTSSPNTKKNESVSKPCLRAKVEALSAERSLHDPQCSIANPQAEQTRHSAYGREHQDPGSSSPRTDISTLQQLPEPTFTRQLEAITGRLDHLMFLQRNAFDTPHRERNGMSQDNSPLRNTGESNSGSQESSRSSDSINITSRLLTRLTESLSRQIQMVQQVRLQQTRCTDHQEPSSTNVGAQAHSASINNARSRGQELLSLMVDSLTTFSSQSNSQRNSAFEHVHNMSEAFLLLQGLYIVLHLGLELTDLLLSHYISSYEPSDPDDSSTTSAPQPCLCLNSNGSPSSPSLSRLPVGSPNLWNGAGNAISSTNSRGLGPLTRQSVLEALGSHTRTPVSSSSVSRSSTTLANDGPPRPSSSSDARRPWLVNLHSVLDSPRLSVRPPPILESLFRSQRSFQNETQPSVQIPVSPQPSNSNQVDDVQLTETQQGQRSVIVPSLVRPSVPTGTVRRSVQPSPRAAVHQYFQQQFQQQENIFPSLFQSQYTRPGSLRLRSRLLHPPVTRQPQERADSEIPSHQSLFFHFDYTRNIGHFVREPTFATEEHRIHRIQLWDFSDGNIPDISRGDENLVVAECKIHNDASVDISADGHLLVALLPAPRPTGHPQLPSNPVGQTVGVYSLVWESLGQLLYTTSLDQPAVSVALSPSAAYLLVGLGTRRTMLMPNDQHALAQIFRLEGAKPGRPIGARGRLNSYRYIEVQNNHVSVGINCIRWAPVSGQGIVYGTNTGTLVILR